MASVGVESSKGAAYPDLLPAYDTVRSGGPAGGSNWATDGVAGATVVMTGQPGLSVGPMHGSTVNYWDRPVFIVCQYCHATVYTTIIHTPGNITWLICILLVCFGIWLGCCLIPFCLNSCMDVVHICPNCRATVGRYSRY